MGGLKRRPLGPKRLPTGRRHGELRRLVRQGAERTLTLPVVVGGGGALVLGALVGLAVGLSVQDDRPAGPVEGAPVAAAAVATPPEPATPAPAGPTPSPHPEEVAMVPAPVEAIRTPRAETAPVAAIPAAATQAAPSAPEAKVAARTAPPGDGAVMGDGAAMGAGNGAGAEDLAALTFAAADARAPAATPADGRKAATGAREAGGGPPAWRRYAVAAPPGADDGPRIALVIDDLGLDRSNARRVIALPGPLTLAFMVYADNLPALTAEARRAGHELLVHVPMEPEDPVAHDPGPVVLQTGLPAGELRARLVWGLERFGGYVGINNHMGSRFTASAPDMRPVLDELQRRGLLFLDSRTTADSVAARLAGEMGLPHAARDVFLDDDPAPEAVRAQLARLERLARETGVAVGIGHPRDATIEALADWLKGLGARGVRLVPVSDVVRRRRMAG